MSKNKTFLNVLLSGILVILFWVSIWDITEMLMDKILDKFDNKHDNGRIIGFGILSIISVFILYQMNSIQLLD